MVKKFTKMGRLEFIMILSVLATLTMVVFLSLIPRKTNTSTTNAVSIEVPHVRPDIKEACLSSGGMWEQASDEASWECVVN
ncbi:hypothetical protein A2801_01480 [Candidatus Woesebacteria bacterium RIFCSPHIGHO2_01_FULL_41_10]|uniref:Uncharacterized protein n=1 Tax=Candidatus Woesebacteria bacterium RIFCSPHIGHO2_01_FULL_41_10 TaxID=1802500 RepID=A0A1F7YPZ6_9BACT|nr:MAG: hypothetical protein A2801_01480 [Candidatus Woesebacteria bacterium RIFCSPHIGHO2_01_FULL_41_10]